jgi:CRISP-associated protein Cas1
MQLYINTYGTSLKIKEGILSIKKDEKINRVPLAKVNTIFVTRSVLLSTDVLYECLNFGIDLVVCERNGQPIGRLWNNKFGSISIIRKRQLQFSKSDYVTTWVTDHIAEKIDNQKELLYCFLSMDEAHKKDIHKAIGKLEDSKQKLLLLKELPMQEAAAKIRSYEGYASRIYFQCVNMHLPFRYQFESRSRRPALDMVNAMLNYAYGILYGHLEAALIKAGIDPFIGFFHRDEYNRPVLTYDLIEPFRPWADWVVFHLCINEAISENQFEIDEGGFWLAGESKRLLIQHFADFFDEIIDYKNRRFTRMLHLEKVSYDLSNHLEACFPEIK